MRPLELVPGDPDWLNVAKAFQAAGIAEYAGKAAHPLITGMLQAFTQLRGNKYAATDETAWCSAFVCACIEMSGIDSPKHALASKWARWGLDVDFRRGCIVVFDRHVAFGLAVEDKHVICLGGNQMNAVNEQKYPVYSVKGYRWPNAQLANGW